ncbi:helix-turn-helix domain-containing protein [Bacillus atrophaeus]|uniref:helix-turn-helix domain-containing protein n=1 Tax=Bacillus atrophaeus TaxID=1452 RepID=UPI002282DF88|nr:helix-turn-helix domain-containing protein [Bacillus atrophaeus]MCY8514705.1 helix-turn-helix domain-containing protein [Bacillus atrophaeus]MCY8990786.1 helix-turn-helix domain-containing protein [Bacillus atrophaeus]MCY9158849.1 helix-turn-helix domain-containing protein [Bacillus atrophaeus]
MQILTVREVSQLIKLYVSKVYSLAKSGQLPTIRISGSIRIIFEELENHLKGGDIK